MIKKIMGLLGYKVFTKKEYDFLTDRIASCGVYYRSVVSDENSYHHGDRVVTVKVKDLGDITLVENCVWDDVKDKINNGRVKK